MKPAKAKAAMQGNVRVYPTRFSLRRRADLFHSPVHSSFQHLASANSGLNAMQSSSRPAHFRLWCPKCSAASLDASARKLYGPRGWTTYIELYSLRQVVLCEELEMPVRSRLARLLSPPA